MYQYLQWMQNYLFIVNIVFIDTFKLIYNIKRCGRHSVLREEKTIDSKQCLTKNKSFYI